MKTITTLLLITLVCSTSFAQKITGQWNGALEVQGMKLRLVFHISKTDNGFKTTMDSPDQGANGIPVTNTSFEENILKLEIPAATIEFEGELNKDKIITGTFKQGGKSFPLNLSREEIAEEKKLRPQEPIKPYPYYSEDVTFKNTKAGITLAGTLTLPKEDGQFPVVVLISGSGPQNRDEELLGHKPFLVLSDYLTRNGIGVLRFDDRGTALSEGDFNSATSADFATDVEAAVAYLKSRKEINKKEIGLIGHSEGGLIAPMVASKSKDIAFIVLLAGPGITGASLLLMQQRAIGKASGMDEADLNHQILMTTMAVQLVKNAQDDKVLKKSLTDVLKTMDVKADSKNNTKTENEEVIKTQVDAITTPWMQFFIKYDPAPILEKIKCPVLAINGENDLQVPAKENLAAIKIALETGDNKDFETKELKGLNHLFQESKTGLPSEYANIEQTFSPVAMDEVLKWIKKQIK